MKVDDKPEPSRGHELPSVSDFAAEAAPYSVPAPQIEGYEIISELGQAGQGRVWRALQLSTHREVALKVPRVELLGSRKALALFEREVELAARLKHPNIARIYDSGIYQGVYYYAMELIEGLPLDKYAEQHDFTQRQIMELMRTICEAVQHAHQHGVIHRDIKPSNIIVTKDDQPHVVDFGLATSITQSDTFKTVSFEGEVTGTPAYMSPEQAAGHRDELDTRTDVYSIGVVFYRVLTGNFPYDVASSMLQTLRNIQETEPNRPSKLLRHLDSDIEAIVLKALAKEPSHRYQSVAELQHDIERWLEGLPILAKSDSSLYLLRKVLTKHRYTTTVVALLLVIVFGFSCFSWQVLARLRDSNKELNDTNASLKQALAESGELALRESFSLFLENWHRDRAQMALFAAAVLPTGGREEVAARFLLDPRALAEKVTGFRQKLQQSEPCFSEFIVGEHHYNDGNRAEAEKAYKNCLSYDDYLKADQWLATRVRSRLYELADKDARPEVSSAGMGDTR